MRGFSIIMFLIWIVVTLIFSIVTPQDVLSAWILTILFTLVVFPIIIVIEDEGDGDA